MYAASFNVKFSLHIALDTCFFKSNIIIFCMTGSSDITDISCLDF